jgi:hypothetical protein
VRKETGSPEKINREIMVFNAKQKTADFIVAEKKEMVNEVIISDEKRLRRSKCKK